MDLNTQYGMVSGLEALSDSGLQVTEDNQHRVGIIFGSGGAAGWNWSRAGRTRWSTAGRGGCRRLRCPT